MIVAIAFIRSLAFWTAFHLTKLYFLRQANHLNIKLECATINHRLQHTSFRFIVQDNNNVREAYDLLFTEKKNQEDRMGEKRNDKNFIAPLSVDTIQKVIDYIEEHIYEVITPKAIALHLYTSVTTLNVLFKTVCNITIMEYIRCRRLTLAGQDLKQTNLPVIELAYKYGYETPEAFTKAFTRCYGFPPSFVRRVNPNLGEFQPFHISLNIEGGWEELQEIKYREQLSKSSFHRQEIQEDTCYDVVTTNQGGKPMENGTCHISVSNMQQKEDWMVLKQLASELDKNHIKFKFDGKTMIFAHGLEFKQEKFCITFKWEEEESIKDFFGYTGEVKSTFKGFKYFDTTFQKKKIRCMSYGDYPGDSTDEALFNNAEPVNVDGQIIMVQTLKFYLENAEQGTEPYKLVEDYLNNKK